MLKFSGCLNKTLLGCCTLNEVHYGFWGDLERSEAALCSRNGMSDYRAYSAVISVVSVLNTEA